MTTIQQWIKTFLVLSIMFVFPTLGNATQFSSTWGTAPWTWTDGNNNDTIVISPSLSATIDITYAAAGTTLLGSTTYPSIDNTNYLPTLLILILMNIRPFKK